MANYNIESALFIYNFFKAKGFKEFTIAGLLGNWLVESFLRSDNAQNSYMNKFGETDESYTKKVDEGTWKRPDTGATFTTDSVGYGLAQWTSSGRKAGLLELCKSIGVSISNMAAQCEYAYREITRSKSLVEELRQASSPEEAAVILMVKYERPASKDDPEKQKIRADYARMFYDDFVVLGAVRDNRQTEKPKKQFVIGIDPGHATEKQNHSPVVSAYYESAFTFKAAMYAKARFEALGCIVILTRTNINDNPSLKKRGLTFNGCDAAFSFHSNACDDETVDHPSIIIPRDDGGVDMAGCIELGNRLGNSIHVIMDTKQVAKVYSKDAKYDRNGDKILGNDEYYGIMDGAQQTDCPIYMIVEHGFHTNKANATWLLNEANVKRIAEADADVIYNFLCEKYGTESTPQEHTTDYIEYVVRSGDRLSKIAQSYNTTVKAIQAINPEITDPNKIKVGQVIKIPVDQAKAQRIAEIRAQIAALEAELRELGVDV